MATRDPGPRQKKNLLLSLALGALLVPLAALGASSIVSDASSQQPPTPATTVPITTSTTAAGPTGAADLDLACGQEGLQLVVAEADGSISEVQQAALDALRDICGAQGRALPAPAVSAAPSPPTTVAVQPTTSVATPDDDDDDRSGHGRGGDDDREDDDDDDDREDDD